MQALLALDQGTSSSRAMVFGRDGRLLAVAQRELTQHFPQPGWVEHDADEIWAGQLACAREAVAKAGVKPAAIGITNQRETTVLWDRRTGEPLHRALVWQDRRTAGFCEQLKQQGLEPRVRALTESANTPDTPTTAIKRAMPAKPDTTKAFNRSGVRTSARTSSSVAARSTGRSGATSRIARVTTGTSA